MNPERAIRLQELFRHAVALEGEARARYLAEACGGDAELWREAQALLAADAGATDADLVRGPLALAALSADESSAGRTIGPYRLVRLLGSGGMGSVYLAEREDVEKHVAFKLLHGRFRSTDTSRRFLVEQRALARLEHPHIARFLDAGIAADGSPYLVMELVAGESIVAHAASLGLRERLLLFDAVLAAITYAHQHLVVHRDLKPSNIFVDRDGTVKLLDFGIAKLLEDEGDEALTREGARLMTPEYAAPEQIRGEPVTPATDVYSLGVLLFELLTETRPYSLGAATPAQIERMVSNSVVPLPSTRPATSLRAAGIPPDLDAICLRALEKSPDDRYPTAADLRADVQRYLSDRPVEARVPTVTYRLRKFIRRHRVAVVAAILLAAAGAAGVGAVIWQAQRAERERARAEVERQRAERALAESESVSDFLIGLFEAQDPAIAMGKEPTARELIERGRRRAAQLTEQPVVRARLLDTIGRVYHSLGDYAGAEAVLREALEVRQRELGASHADVAASLHHLASLLHDKGVYPEAEQHYTAALMMRRSLLGANDPLIAEILARYGLLVLRARNDDKQAETLIGSALDISRAAFGNEHPKVAAMLNTFAAVPDSRGDHARSEALLRQALAIQRTHLGPLHPATLETLGNLGVTQAAKGDLAAGEATMREVLGLHRRVFGPSHAEIAIGLNNLASVLQRQKRLSEAEATYREAIVVADATLGPEHHTTAWFSANLGAVLTQQRRFAEAETVYVSALSRLRAGLGEQHSRVRRVRLRMADLFDASGRPARAAEQRALATPSPAAR
jgi:tetratricopeptide (TPR) repeat protein